MDTRPYRGTQTTFQENTESEFTYASTATWSDTNKSTNKQEIGLERAKPMKLESNIFGNPAQDYIGTAIQNTTKMSNNSKNRLLQVQKNIYWKTEVQISWLSPLFAGLTIFYMLMVLGSGVVPTGKNSRVAIGFVILIFLAFANPTKYSWSSVILAGTATLLLLTVVVLEAMIGRQQCLVTYLSLAVVFRILHHKTLFDNFAICLSYSADIVALNSEAQTWFTTSKIVLWISFFLGVLLYQVYRRMSFRIWEHVRVLLILREKCDQEAALAYTTINAHFPLHLQDYVFANAQKSNIAPSNSVTDTDTAGEQQPSIIQAALSHKVIPSFKESIVKLDQLTNLDGWLQREVAAIIAIKLDVGNDRECDLTSISTFVMHDLFDILANEHQITSVRKFGDVWIGCVGFAHSHGHPVQDCFHAVAFASDIMAIAKAMDWKLCCAIDSGNIIGGFVGNMQFDLYGAEIRWVLYMVEAKKYGSVLVSSSLKQKLSSSKEEDSKVRFDKTFVQPIWKPNTLEQVLQVSNWSSLATIDAQKIAEYMTRLNSPGSKSTIINWQKVQRSLNSKTIIKQADFNSPGLIGSFARDSKKVQDNSLFSSLYSAGVEIVQAMYDEWCVDRDLGIEFQTDVISRYGVDILDPILEKYSEQQLLADHLRFEADIISLVKKECFNSFWRKVFLISSVNYNENTELEKQASISTALPEDDSMPQFSDYFLIINSLNDIYKYFISILYPTKPTSNRKYAKKSVGNLNIYKSDSNKVIPTESDSDVEGALYSAPILTSTTISQSSSSNDQSIPKSKRFQQNLEVIDEEESIDRPSSSSKSSGVSITPSSSRKYSGASVPISASTADDVSTISDSAANTNRTSSNQFDDNSDSLKPSGGNDELMSTSLPFTRTWSKYSSDGKQYFLNIAQANCAYIVITLITWYVIYGNYPEHRHLILSLNLDPFLLCYYIQLLIPTLFDRKYDTRVFAFLVPIHVLYVVTVPQGVFCTSVVYGVDKVFNNGSSVYNSFGDWGGECRFLLLMLYGTIISLRQPILVATGYNILILGALGLQTQVSCGISRQSWIIVLITIILRLALYWVVEFRTFLSYIIEHKLVSEAKRNYQKQFTNSRNIFKACTPQVPPKQAIDLYSPRRYRNCAIVVIHIKAADILPGILDHKNVCLFLKQIYHVINSCIVECGMLKVTQFSGVIVAVACKDLYLDSMDTIRTPITHISRAVMFMKSIQQKIDLLNSQGNFHVSLGMGLNHGSVTMGFLGNLRYCFDISGSARDIACAMASFQNEGAIYVSEAFSAEVNSRIRNNDDSNSEGFLVINGNRETSWYKIDGTFGGIDLSNFEYICMLGRGGYGSVHLLRENSATGNKYAIKAIPRRQGSNTSKLIQREFQILQQMNHKNVVKFEYCIVYRTRIFLVMSYVSGGNLREIVEKNKPDLSVLRYWFAELVLALEYVHSQGIIHRDVKPANCMIDINGHLKLADFGLSKSMLEHDTNSSNDMQGKQEEVLSTHALSAIKTLLPLNRTANNDTGLKDKSIEILLVDADESSKNRLLLSAMYYTVVAKNDLEQAEQALLNPTNTLDLIMLGVDSFDHPSIVNSYQRLKQKVIHTSTNEYQESNDPRVTFNSKYVDSSSWADKNQDSGENTTNNDFAKNGKHLDIIRWFCQDDRFHQIPLIVISKDDSYTMHSNCFNAGAKEVYTKSMIEGARHVIWKYVRAYRLRRNEEREEEHVTAVVNSSTSTSTVDNTTMSYKGNLELSLGNSMNSIQSIDAGGSQKLAIHASKLQSGLAHQSAVGTLHFMAPEVITETNPSRKYGKAVDWWACGITFYECATREHLFKGNDKDEVFAKILKAPIDLSLLTPMSKSFEDLVRGLLIRDCTTRLGSLGTSAIRKHEFFRNIDWVNISDSTEMPFRPTAQHYSLRCDPNDRALFYGDIDVEVKEKTVIKKTSKSRIKSRQRHRSEFERKARRWIQAPDSNRSVSKRSSMSSHSFSHMSLTFAQLPEGEEEESSGEAEVKSKSKSKSGSKSNSTKMKASAESPHSNTKDIDGLV